MINGIRRWIERNLISKLMLNDFIRRTYIQLRGYVVLKYKLNIKRPQKYNEKLNHRKINYYKNSNHLFELCTNKFLVRDYVKEKIGDKYLVPLVLVTKKLSLNDISLMPPMVAIKTSSGSQGDHVKIIKDSSLIDKKIVRRINNANKVKYGKSVLEPWYDKTTKVILVEELINNNGNLPNEFKVYCFWTGDKFVAVIRHIKGRGSNKTSSFYDISWNYIDVKYMHDDNHLPIEKPVFFDEMIEISKKLSADFNHVRVDLMENNNKLYFGEITIVDSGGWIHFIPSSYDDYFGEKWRIVDGI
jgi:hypothetical protein